jgi:hypothetical protein
LRIGAMQSSIFVLYVVPTRFVASKLESVERPLLDGIATLYLKGLRASLAAVRYSSG